MERVKEEGDVIFSEAHGRRDADDIAVEAAFAEEQAHFAGAFEEGGGGCWIGLFGLGIFDKFEADHEAAAPNIANNGMFLLKLAETLEKLLAAFSGLFLVIFIEENGKGGESLGTGNGIAAESVEVDALGEGLGDGGGGDNGSEGAAIADALGHSDDVGENAVILKPPEVFPSATKTSLDFIGDAKPPGRPDMSIDGL